MAPVSALACRAARCAGVAADGSGLCPDHRRSLKLSTTIQDAVREYLLSNNGTKRMTEPTTANIKLVIEAGEHLARGIALLIGTRLSDIKYNPQPIAIEIAGMSNSSLPTPWRVSFSWQAGVSIESDDDDDYLDEDDEDDDIANVH